MKICSVCDRCFEDCEAYCFDPSHGELTDGRHSVDIVSGYIIERVITSSLKVSTYQARQIEYGQGCTISIAEADATQFLSDAKSAARLFDAGVAGVVESGELSNGSGFAVFEELGGTSLRDVLREGSLSLLDQIRIARQAAEAVRGIHSVGLLHGIIRPENLSVGGVGTDQLSVKVHNIDLGSAFGNGILSNRFSMDLSLDSLRYFAPERFRRETPTAQADVYSLGILLYELLSGHTPFEATSATALAEMHLNQKPPEIRIENFDLRMLLTHTINESLQKQASSRQSSADLFARQLRHIEQLATHVSTPPPAISVDASASSTSRPFAPQPSPRIVQPINVAPALEVLRPAFTPEPTPIERTPIEPTPIAPQVPPRRVQPIDLAPAMEVLRPAFVPEPTDVERTPIEPLPIELAPIEPTTIERIELTSTEPTSIEPAFIDSPIELTPIEPTPVATAPIAAPAISEPLETPTIHPMNAEPPMPFVPTPKRSRLKGMKKRVHSYVSDAKAALTRTPAPTLTLIDWQQPEDDVPSIEAVREDLASCGVTAFEADDEITHVQPPTSRTEVKWNEPTPAKSSPVAVEFAPTPTLIDWQQPEDDVPSIEAVREELASSGVTAAFEADDEITRVRPPVERTEVKWIEPAPAKSSPVAVEFAPTPTLIDWQQPEDDVPSIEAVREELASSGVTAAFEADDEITRVRPPVERTEVKWIEPAPAKPSPVAVEFAPTPTLIDWQQPEDDVPSIEAVREELESSGATVAFEAEEEIQKVRMPAERIEVNWSEPIAERPPRISTAFVPKTMPSLLATDSNTHFLGYQSRGRDLGKLPIYGVALVAFVIVGFGVVRLGTALADDSGGYIGEARPSRIEIPAPAAAVPVGAAAIEPETAVMNIPAQAVVVSAPAENSFEEPISSISKEEPRSAKETVVETTAPSISKPSKRSVSDEPRTAAVKPGSSGRDPFVPSTLVITRAPGRPKAVVVNENLAREARPAKVSSGATRPRIVGVPD